MNACAQWGAPSQWSVMSRRLRREQWERSTYAPDYTVRRPDVGLSARARRVLGSNGVTRFLEFRSYENGWDFGGGGLALTRQSIVGMERFLAHFFGFHASEPSLFLSREGQLILAWEDPSDERIELEFGQNNDATLYLPMYGDHGRTFNLDQELSELIEAIPQ